MFTALPPEGNSEAFPCHLEQMTHYLVNQLQRKVRRGIRPGPGQVERSGGGIS